MNGTKYLLLLCDGLADEPAPGQPTPMEAARLPHMDALAVCGELGTVRTVPPCMTPGSDVANLGLLGYDPRRWYAGRAPLEAAGLGLVLAPDDAVFRCNLVTLGAGETLAERRMLDHTAGGITSADAKTLLDFLNSSFADGTLRFCAGSAYRNLLVLHGRDALPPSPLPPHDLLGQRVGAALPKAGVLREVLERCARLLAGHPLNLARAAAGLPPANACWLWSGGRTAALPDFTAQWGLAGAVITASDLVGGIARLAGLRRVPVPGATGDVDTDYAGKARAACSAFAAGADFVFLHVEAPDECGHRGDRTGKIFAAEQIDRLILGPLLCALQGQPCRVLVLPDHATPVRLRTHTAQPVPYVLADTAAVTAAVRMAPTDVAAVPLCCAVPAAFPAVTAAAAASVAVPAAAAAPGTAASAPAAAAPAAQETTSAPAAQEEQPSGTLRLQSAQDAPSCRAFTERAAACTGLVQPSGEALFRHFLGR